MVNTMQLVGGSIGTALLTAVAAQATIRYVTPHAKSGETNVVAMAVAHGYSVGYTVAAAIFLGAAVITGLLLRKHAPQAGNPTVAPVPETPVAAGSAARSTPAIPRG
jgi:hypothetical protein